MRLILESSYDNSIQKRIMSGEVEYLENGLFYGYGVDFKRRKNRNIRSKNDLDTLILGLNEEDEFYFVNFYRREREKQNLPKLTVVDKTNVDNSNYYSGEMFVLPFLGDSDLSSKYRNQWERCLEEVGSSFNPEKFRREFLDETNKFSILGNNYSKVNFYRI